MKHQLVLKHREAFRACDVFTETRNLRSLNLKSDNASTCYLSMVPRGLALVVFRVCPERKCSSGSGGFEGRTQGRLLRI